MRPNYLIIGAMKAGTTSAIHHFNQHPDVFLEGELHFFDKDVRYNRGIGYYESQFISSKKYVGEKTPAYGYVTYCIDRIYEHYPNMKLIMLLREPVSRAYSQYNAGEGGRLVSKPLEKRRRLDRPSLLTSFSQWQTSLPSSRCGCAQSSGRNIVRRGLYIDHIEYILSKFDRENLYIGIAEEVLQNPLAEYNKMFDFLGAKPLSRDDFVFISDVHKREYIHEAWRSKAFQIGYEIYEPYNERLYSFLGREIPSWKVKGV